MKLMELLDKYIAELKEGSVVAITSKVAAICEGRTIPADQADKKELVKKEADYYLPAALSKFDFSFTILHHTMVPEAGIDLSNGNGHYVLWPGNPQKTANEARKFLQNKFHLKNVGVVITDSTARPLHYGTEGVAIGYSGFAPSNNYVGTPDLFGRKLEVSISNVVDALASAAVLVMGEGSEQTPLAIIEELPFVNFQDHDPTKEELEGFYLEHFEDDLFEPFLANMDWQKGGRKATSE